jgi:formiminotetrahydrofolate cyclodeaminase
MDNQSTKTWLDSLAAKQPTPGGGGAAALLTSISAALLGMVSIYTTGPRWQEQESRMLELNSELADLRQEALALIDADAAAFTTVGAAYKLPKETAEDKKDRKAAIQKALLTAAQPPQAVAKLAIRLVDISEEIAKHGNANVISDVAVASSTAEAALSAAIVNIEINQSFLDDSSERQKLGAAIQQAEAAIKRASSVTETVRNKIGGSSG